MPYNTTHATRHINITIFLIAVTVTSGCTCDLSIEANTTQQEIEVKVTGEASSTYYWRVKAMFIIAA